MSSTSTLTRPSNVYYLAPSAATPARPPRLSTGLVLRLRLLSLWWRLRLTTGEMWDALRRFGRPPATEVDTTFLEQRAEIILAAPPRPQGPARVIDLETARLRRRG